MEQAADSKQVRATRRLSLSYLADREGFLGSIFLLPAVLYIVLLVAFQAERAVVRGQRHRLDKLADSRVSHGVVGDAIGLLVCQDLAHTLSGTIGHLNLLDAPAFWHS